MDPAILSKAADIMDQADKEEEFDTACQIIELLERERVAPKFEAWRDHYTYKVAEGGRGAGAKSWSTVSLLVQKYNYSPKQLQCLCVREYMNSLAESSYSLIKKTIERLGYTDWVFTKSYIRNQRNGSYFIFRGLRDLRAAETLKSYEGFDDLFADEASSISMDSWTVVVPTLRKPDKEIWVIYNRILEMDPCHEYFVANMRPNTSYIHLEPGPIDNPWWGETSLQEDMDADFKRDKDEAVHIWHGLPRVQGHKAVLSRVAIRQAMDRDLEADLEEGKKLEGEKEAGVDVARFGNNNTEMYLRKGMKIIKHKTIGRNDIIEAQDPTRYIALTIWDFIDRDPGIPVKIDVGYNPGVADNLTGLGANVVEVAFGQKAEEEERYPNAASEMWFEFDPEEADIPDDSELMQQLSTRQYFYDKKGRRNIESKDDYIKRHGSSPDKADALLLCYYGVYYNRVWVPTDYSADQLGF